MRLKMYVGADTSFTFRVYKADGSYEDISSWRLYFYGCKTKPDASPFITKDSNNGATEIDIKADGQFIVYIDAADTSSEDPADIFFDIKKTVGGKTDHLIVGDFKLMEVGKV